MRSHLLRCGLVLLTFTSAASAVLFTDGFESYNNGTLDKNQGSSANPAPNGSGNPWFGPGTPNAQVVGTEASVSPHSGSKMIRATAPSDFDQLYYNLSYRQNGGSVVAGNLQVDWYFYDPTGQNAGSTNYRDYAAVTYYNNIPTNTDYPGGVAPTGLVQRLSLGAFNGNAASQTVYEARIIGDNAGDAGAADGTWFLCGVARSVGWHHAQIVIGPELGDGTNLVTFNIDGAMALSRNSKTTIGFNALELNMGFGSQRGYFDDVSVVPEPASLLLLAGGLVLVRRRR